MAKTKSAYAQKLLDPRWQRKRLEVLERDGFACCHCGDTTATLHVHHTRYEFGKDPWDYEPRLLRTYCENCHEYAEWLREWFKKFFFANTLDLQDKMRELTIGLDIVVRGDDQVVEAAQCFSDFLRAMQQKNRDKANEILDRLMSLHVYE